MHLALGYPIKNDFDVYGRRQVLNHAMKVLF
jgi:hypothetical protein